MVRPLQKLSIFKLNSCRTGVFKQLSESEAARRSVAESRDVSAQCTPGSSPSF